MTEPEKAFHGAVGEPDTSNRWLVESLQWLVDKAKANGCQIVNADIFVTGLKYPDNIQLGDARFEVHTYGR